MMLSRVRDEWPAEWLELFNERAAIMEVLGKMSRADAEKEAELDIRRRALKDGKSKSAAKS